jgi:hypothetical protein
MPTTTEPTNPDTIAAITITDMPTEPNPWHRADAMVSLARAVMASEDTGVEDGEEPTDIEIRGAAAFAVALTREREALSAGQFVALLAATMAMARIEMSQPSSL